jgi:NAD(P)-dependent dehydrogenase (short-subunit alcohol dehydrogenase family)
VGSILVLGARSLGGVILDRFIGLGWRAAAIARSPETLAAIQERGAAAIQADAMDPDSLRAALARATEELGTIDVIVNAISVSDPRPGEPWGGGPVVDATLEQYERWGAAVGRVAFVVLSESARLLRGQGKGGTLIQFSNESSRRLMPGQAAWSVGHHAVRVLTHTAAEELRSEGIHVCLIVANGTIESAKTAPRLAAAGVPIESVIDPAGIAEAVEFVAAQQPRAWSYELIVGAAGKPWLT